MEKKKTVKFAAEEEHTNFEKTRVQPTKLFDVDDLGISETINPLFEQLSTEDLIYKLDYEDLSEDEISQIKSILRNREN